MSSNISSDNISFNQKLMNIISTTTRQKVTHDISNSMIFGSLSGIIAKTCIAPIERIKFHFQISSEPFTLTSAGKRSLNLIRTEGFFSLWKGHFFTILRVAPYAGLHYTIHDGSEHYLRKLTDVKENEKLSFSLKFLAGSLAGFGATIMTYPLDVIRVRRAIGLSLTESFKQRGFLQGLTPTLLGIVPYSGIAWLAKQTMTEIYKETISHEPKLWHLSCINATAGLTGQFLTYPLDVLRRRMQVAKRFEGQHITLKSTFINLLKTEGIKGFTKGFTMNIIKGPISLSISLTLYDYFKRNHGDKNFITF